MLWVLKSTTNFFFQKPDWNKPAPMTTLIAILSIGWVSFFHVIPNSQLTNIVPQSTFFSY
jgi:hypothetical protein